MDAQAVGNIIQVFVGLIALFAGGAAIVVASRDRRNAREIAEKDRRIALRQSRLLFEWEAAKRLSVLEARGGHVDPVISKDMGAETMALVALLGKDRVPEMWARRVGKTDAELRAFVLDESQPQYLRDAVEAERAVQSIAVELDQLAES